MNQTQHLMTTNTHLQTWVSREFKDRFAQVAKAQGLSESALLRRLLERVVLADRQPDDEMITRVDEVSSAPRVSVRLRADDLLLLRERARARGLPTSTYISYLVRSHLRAQAPLPNLELAALKRSVAEIGAIGRNINQIARAVNQQQWPSGPDAAVLSEMIRVLAVTRAQIKALINANLASWDSGHGTTAD
jgi:antitoxin component of RelBE/YafQ-DinJ toxin-antitoxin module